MIFLTKPNIEVNKKGWVGQCRVVFYPTLSLLQLLIQDWAEGYLIILWVPNFLLLQPQGISALITYAFIHDFLKWYVLIEQIVVPNFILSLISYCESVGHFFENPISVWDYMNCDHSSCKVANTFQKSDYLFNHSVLNIIVKYKFFLSTADKKHLDRIIFW